jgi:hypothetical protein
VGKTNEKRAEQRLRYRWPVRFAMRVGQKPLRGQIVDVTSRGLAFLCHPGENSPHPDQLVTTGFGVPHFNSHGSFDTVFFNRVGRVCRVDSLSDKVSRVAIQFAEPLFFQPGEQNISDSEAQQRLEAKARSVIKAMRTSGTSDEAPAKTGSRTAVKRKSPAQAKRRVSSEKAARGKTRAYAEQIAKVKAEAAQKIAKVSAEAADAIARIEAGSDAEASTCDGKRGAGGKKRNAKPNASPPADRGLLKRVDSFITDKSKVF